LIQDLENPPIEVWRFKTSHPILSSPIIDQGSVYFGGCDSTFYSVSLTDGKVKWRLKTQGQIRSTPLIHNRFIFLNGGDGIIYKLNKTSGTIVWSSHVGTEKQYDFADYHQSSPILYEGVLYFGLGDGSVTAIEEATGEKLWSYQTGDAVHTTPAISGDKIFVGSFDGNVYALDMRDGTLRWKFKTVGHRFFPKGEVQGSPAVHAGLIFIGARDYNVYALDQEKGFARWNKAFVRGWGLVNEIHDSVLYIGGADERILVSVDPSTGKENWRKKMDFLIFGKNAYSENLMYVGTTLGKFHAIDRSNGNTIWTVTTDGYRLNRLKYFKEDDSYRDDIYSIIKSSEEFLLVEYELGGIFSTPAINTDHLVIATSEGMVYCFKRT
jgi:eukaryotic-like serine/threonine-protein kinase